MIDSAISSPVTGASRIPLRKWPVATVTFSQPGSGPMIGRPSGELGRRPAQVKCSRRLRICGANSNAARRTCARPRCVGWKRKPTSSSVEPAKTRPLARGTRYPRDPQITWRSGVDILPSAIIWPRIGRVGTSTPSLAASGRVHGPAASTSRSQATSPSAVRTAVTRPARLRKPTTGACSTMRAPRCFAARASASVKSWLLTWPSSGQSNPPTTLGLSRGSTSRASAPSSSTSSRPNSPW